MSGDHGLAAKAMTAVVRSVRWTGSNSHSTGKTAGPSGLPWTAELSSRFTFGLLAARAWLEDFSSNPPAIHFRSSSPLVLSGLWHLKQLFRKTGVTWSS